MKTIEPKVLTEEQLSSMDEEERKIAEMLLLLESILEVSQQFKKWGNQEKSDVLVKAVEAISVVLFDETEDITEEKAEEKIKLSIEKIEKVAASLKECDNIEYSVLINKIVADLSALIFGVDFYKEWNTTFEICYKISLEKGDVDLANEIKKYIGVSREQELGEDFTSLLNRCIDIVKNY